MSRSKPGPQDRSQRDASNGERKFWLTLLTFTFAAVVVPFTSDVVEHVSYFLLARFAGGFASLEWMLLYLHLPRATLDFALLFAAAMVPSLWRHPGWVIPLLLVLVCLIPLSGAFGAGVASLVNQFVLSTLQSPNTMNGFVNQFLQSFSTSVQTAVATLVCVRFAVFLSGWTCRPPWWAQPRRPVWSIRKLLILTAMAAVLIGTLRLVNWQQIGDALPFFKYQIFALAWSSTLNASMLSFWCWLASTRRRPLWLYATFFLGVVMIGYGIVSSMISGIVGQGFIPFGIWRFFNATLVMILASGFAFAMVRAFGYRFGPSRHPEASVPSVAIGVDPPPELPTWNQAGIEDRQRFT